MLKYSLILLGAYFLYYAGNVIYDLFIKKGKTVQTDESEEFLLGDFVKMEEPQRINIGIEDVERIKTPKSFLKSELQFDGSQTSFEENPDLTELRERFEAEQDIDDLMPRDHRAKNEVETQPETPELTMENEQKENTESTQEDDSKKKETDKRRKHWKDLLNLSETTVIMVANYEGQKVYHSTI